MAGSAKLAQWRATAKVARSVAPAYWERMQRDRRRKVLPAPYRPEPARWPDTGLYAAWLGHSSVLIKVDGFTILTDPVLGSRCGVLVGPMTVGLKRLVAPALTKSELPPIDLILLSHAHFDHFDRGTLRAIESAKTSVITASQTSDLLSAFRYASVEELGWGETARAGPATIRAFEVNHWGARLRSDTYRGYNGYLIETAKRRIVFGGDTAFTGALRKLRTSRPVDLAILPIGAYDPWIRVHCNPEQAWRMAVDCKAQHILPVHHQTFQLSREPYYEPIERLLSAASGDSHAVAVQRIGQQWSFT